MKKIMKIVGIVIAVVVITFGILVGIGYKIHTKAENFGISQGLKVSKAVKQSDDVLCAGNASGIILAGKTDVNQTEVKFYPICVGLFSETTIGTWAK